MFGLSPQKQISVIHLTSEARFYTSTSETDTAKMRLVLILRPLAVALLVAFSTLPSNLQGDAHNRQGRMVTVGDLVRNPAQLDATTVQVTGALVQILNAKALYFLNDQGETVELRFGGKLEQLAPWKLAGKRVVVEGIVRVTPGRGAGLAVWVDVAAVTLAP